MLIKGPRLNLDNIGDPDRFKLFMGNHLIERTDNYKYLGITFDDKLDWKLQIDKICSKLSSVCGVISKVRHYLDRKSLMLIYNSLIESRLRYGILSWSTAARKQLNRLKVLQNKALRFIHFSSLDIYWASTMIKLSPKTRKQEPAGYCSSTVSNTDKNIWYTN